ncbi:MAG: hypothetical protein ABH823_00795 [bacterium]
MHNNKFFESLADIAIKVFQIVFAMMVIGGFLKERFDFVVFSIGLVISAFCLTAAIMLYYNAFVRGGQA